METAPVSVLFEDESVSLVFGNAFGLLGREKIDIMLRREMILARDAIDPGQKQPASLDLRLGPELIVFALAFFQAKIGRSANNSKF